MTKLRIGLVDIDTSHPNAWIPILRELGHEVVGVYDSGTVHPEGYAAAFTAERQIPKVYSSLNDMASEVDLAIVHACNWDVHVNRAQVFVDAGKAVFIDKPMAGNLRDLNTLIEWEKRGARVTGGSSLRYCEEIAAFMPTLEADEKINYVYAGTGNDEFNYGIHGYSTIQGLLGAGIVSVRHLSGTPQHQIELVWKNGARGILTIGAANKWLPFFATVITDRRVVQIPIDARKLYRAMLVKVLPYLAGDEAAPAPLSELIECEKAALAAKLSWERGNQTVFLHDLDLNNPGYDGHAFAAAYRLAFIKRK